MLKYTNATKAAITSIVTSICDLPQICSHCSCLICGSGCANHHNVFVAELPPGDVKPQSSCPVLLGTIHILAKKKKEKGFNSQNSCGHKMAMVCVVQILSY